MRDASGNPIRNAVEYRFKRAARPDARRDTPKNLNQTNISNYVYNSLGELEANLQEDRGYAYNASGLVTRVYNISTNHPIAEYLYNDKGLKYRQTDYELGIGVKETYYIYDAGGVQVATYTQDLTTPAPMVVLQNKETNQLVKLKFGRDIIYATPEHPFYLNGDWVEAPKLKIGSRLFCIMKTGSC